ncbi:MAG TPA: BTAD domain-containing putative transcriptional regulator [Pseudonocardia sp.]|nr:BTAD domain-containing putative transcriptional regulator [Pseudonocardia sp.]
MGPHEAGAPRFRFAVLGPVRAWRDDVEIDPGSPQQCAVLSMLLARRGRFIGLDEIVDGLWNDRPPVTAGATARTYISRLRRAFRDDTGVLIKALSGGYSIDEDAVAVDAARFEALLEESRSTRARGELAMAAEQLELARDLWFGGTAMSGVPGDAAEHERTRLEQLRLTALRELLELKLELGRHAEVMAEVPAVIAAHEMDEQLRETYLLALYRCGRQAEALEEYRKVRAMLGRELGVDPGPRLRALHERLLRADPSLNLAAPPRRPPARPVEGSGRAADGPGAAGQVEGAGGESAGPVPLGVRLQARRHRLFVGRAHERRIFAAAMDGDPADCSVLFLTGLGGIGKTALLQCFADDARNVGRSVLRVDAGALGASRRAFLAVAEQLSTVSDPVLLIDAFEARAELEPWFQTQFLPRLPSRTVVVIASRDRPSPAWRAEGASAGALRAVMLSEFATREALAMLSLRGVPAEQRAAILDLGGGHPLALSLAAEAVLAGDWAADSFQTRRAVVDALLARVVGVLPSEIHRLALQVCAQSYAATEELLAAVLPAAQPPGLLDWLRGLPYLDAAEHTLHVHDVIREALEFDLRWRDPVGYTAMERRITSYLTGVLGHRPRCSVGGGRSC